MSRTDLLRLRPIRSQRERLAERDWRAAVTEVDRQRQALDAAGATLAARREAYRQDRAHWLVDQRERSLNLRDVQRREEDERAVLKELRQLEQQLIDQREQLAAGERHCELVRAHLTTQRRAVERLDALVERLAEETS